MKCFKCNEEVSSTQGIESLNGKYYKFCEKCCEDIINKVIKEKMKKRKA